MIGRVHFIWLKIQCPTFDEDDDYYYYSDDHDDDDNDDDPAWMNPRLPIQGSWQNNSPLSVWHQGDDDVDDEEDEEEDEEEWEDDDDEYDEDYDEEWAFQIRPSQPHDRWILQMSPFPSSQSTEPFAPSWPQYGDVSVEFALDQESLQLMHGTSQQDDEELCLALPLSLFLPLPLDSGPSSSSYPYPYPYPYPRYTRPQSVRILYRELNPNPSKGNRTFPRFLTTVSPPLLLFQHWAVEVSPRA